MRARAFSVKQMAQVADKLEDFFNDNELLVSGSLRVEAKYAETDNADEQEVDYVKVKVSSSRGKQEARSTNVFITEIA